MKVTYYHKSQDALFLSFSLCLCVCMNFKTTYKVYLPPLMVDRLEDTIVKKAICNSSDDG